METTCTQLLANYFLILKTLCANKKNDNKNKGKLPVRVTVALLDYLEDLNRFQYVCVSLINTYSS